MCCGWFGSFKPLITTKVSLFCEISKAISLFFLKQNSTLFHFYSLVNISTSHLAIIKTTCLVLCCLNHQKNPPKALTCSQRCQTFGSGSFGSCRLQDGLSVPWELTGLFQCILWMLFQILRRSGKNFVSVCFWTLPEQFQGVLLPLQDVLGLQQNLCG